MSTASRDAARKAETRWRPRPSTIAILVGVTLVTLAGMLIALPSLGIWPPRTPHDVVVTPDSPYAEGVQVEIVGTPLAVVQQITNTMEVQATMTVVTETYQLVTTTVKITNNVMQSPPHMPGTPTPLPEAAKIINVSVKVLFYDLPRNNPNKKIVGSGVGNYYNPQGLEPKAGAELVVVATDVGEYDKESGYEAFADGVWTDKDPLNTPEPLPGGHSPYPSKAQALIAAHNPAP
ncbi:MAG: hypothetical protein WCD37_21335 [Chloroflexia bacterium]